MSTMIQEFIRETIKWGIGQAIIAISAWIYVFILFAVAIFSCFLRTYKLLMKKKNNP